MYGDASALENSLVALQMVEHRVTYDTMILLLNIQLKEMEIYVHAIHKCSQQHYS